jgi:hypothetical protein
MGHIKRFNEDWDGHNVNDSQSDKIITLLKREIPEGLYYSELSYDRLKNDNSFFTNHLQNYSKKYWRGPVTWIDDKPENIDNYLQKYGDHATERGLVESLKKIGPGEVVPNGKDATYKEVFGDREQYLLLVFGTVAKWDDLMYGYSYSYRLHRNVNETSQYNTTLVKHHGSPLLVDESSRIFADDKVISKVMKDIKRFVTENPDKF